MEINWKPCINHESKVIWKVLSFQQKIIWKWIKFSRKNVREAFRRVMGVKVTPAVYPRFQKNHIFVIFSFYFPENSNSFQIQMPLITYTRLPNNFLSLCCWYKLNKEVRFVLFLGVFLAFQKCSVSWDLKETEHFWKARIPLEREQK